MPAKTPMATREETLGSLAGREASSMADVDIAARHGKEKRQARLCIARKLWQHWDEYKNLALFKLPGRLDKGRLTDEGARAVRAEVVRLLRAAPLTHGFNPSLWFGTTDDVGARMRNCWHLNMGSGLRELTEKHLFRYDRAGATPQMQTMAAGGKASPTFQPNTRPFYASLNYSGARYGGSSAYGKSHMILRDHMRFNAFTRCDSFVVENASKVDSWKELANYHNVYPVIVGAPDGSLDGEGKASFDVLKSLIDHALGRASTPMQEFDGSQYIEAQIPGDLVYARDVEKIVIDRTTVSPTGQIGKRCKSFAKAHGLAIDFI
jgi:hypothetical protein